MHNQTNTHVETDEPRTPANEIPLEVRVSTLEDRIEKLESRGPLRSMIRWLLIVLHLIPDD